jgi:preprotein translocase subunit SecD
MLNRYGWWQWLIIMAVIGPGLFFAFPNLFGDDPGIQVRGVRGTALASAEFDRIRALLGDPEAGLIRASLDKKGGSFRFSSLGKQLKARDILERELNDRYTIALTLLPAAPAWLESLSARPMNLGLDLRGGVHFLMEVDMDSAVRRMEDRYVADLRAVLRKGKVRSRSVRRKGGRGIEIVLRSATDQSKAREVISRELSDLDMRDEDEAAPEKIVVQLSQSAIDEMSKFALEQNITALRNRIDGLGVAEPLVQRQGDRRIVVQLPGVQDTARAKRILGRTATLEIMLVDEKHSLESALVDGPPPGSKIFKMRDGRSVLLKNRVIYSGDNIVDAAASLDTQTGGPIVTLSLDAAGARINQRVTGENIGERMAVLYVETRSKIKTDADGRPQRNKQGRVLRTSERIEEVITAPVIRDQLGKRFQIEGLDSVTEAQDLALMLKAGSLAAPVEIVEERTVGPSLGQANISQGFRSVVIGFVLVLLFMLIYYRLFGLFANLALALNLVMIVAALSLFQATLTLPGVAGIVLTVGMAVDANVLIFERIREELRNGNSTQASIHMGYNRALSTIVDANITTLIAALVLFNFGTGPIKGFAITLSIGIVTSMFTAIILTRGLVNLFYGGRRVDKLAI